DGDAVAAGQVLASALAAAGRGDRGGDDVLQAEPGAGAAVVAGGPPAVLEAGAGQGLLPVLPQEVPVEAGGDVVPRQGLVGVTVPVHHLVEGQPLGGQGLFPAGQVEVLGPFLEGAAVPPHPLDDGADATVTAAGDALGRRGLGVVPTDGEAPGAPGGVAEDGDLAVQLGHGGLAEPLERGVRFGDEPTDRGGDGDRPVVAEADVDAPLAEVGDADDVVVLLGGEADEEVQLHPPPPLPEGGVDGGVEVLFPDQLVDDLPHPPGATLGGEGQPGPADPLDLGGGPDGEGVHPEAGEAHRHPLAVLRVVHDVPDGRLDAGEVGGGQRGEGHLVV